MTFDYETGSIIALLSIFIFFVVFFAVCRGIKYCIDRYEIYKHDKKALQLEEAGLIVIVTAEEYMKLHDMDSKMYQIDVGSLDLLYDGGDCLRILNAEYWKLRNMIITREQAGRSANCQRVRADICKALEEDEKKRSKEVLQ